MEEIKWFWVTFVKAGRKVEAPYSADEMGWVKDEPGFVSAVPIVED